MGDLKSAGNRGDRPDLVGAEHGLDLGLRRLPERRGGRKTVSARLGERQHAAPAVATTGFLDELVLSQNLGVATDGRSVEIAGGRELGNRKLSGTIDLLQELVLGKRQPDLAKVPVIYGGRLARRSPEKIAIAR